MSTENRKDFDKEAAQWDASAFRVKLAHDVADAMIRELELGNHLDALDFGCGTGLLTLKLQPHLKSITGVDNSAGMLGRLQQKVAEQKLHNVHTQQVDFEKGGRVAGDYDLIVSSMVLHHIPDTAAIFKEWLALLRPGGQLCVADLETEDGSFHGDNTGVHHLGFDREHLTALLQATGYRDIRNATATVVTRERDGEAAQQFPIMIMIATRSA